jgi:hypothetical protein
MLLVILITIVCLIGCGGPQVPPVDDLAYQLDQLGRKMSKQQGIGWIDRATGCYFDVADDENKGRVLVAHCPTVEEKSTIFVGSLLALATAQGQRECERVVSAAFGEELERHIRSIFIWPAAK